MQLPFLRTQRTRLIDMSPSRRVEEAAKIIVHIASRVGLDASIGDLKLWQLIATQWTHTPSTVAAQNPQARRWRRSQPSPCTCAPVDVLPEPQAPISFVGPGEQGIPMLFAKDCVSALDTPAAAQHFYIGEGDPHIDVGTMVPRNRAYRAYRARCHMDALARWYQGNEPTEPPTTPTYNEEPSELPSAESDEAEVPTTPTYNEEPSDRPHAEFPPIETADARALRPQRVPQSSRPETPGSLRPQPVTSVHCSSSLQRKPAAFPDSTFSRPPIRFLLAQT